MKRVVCVMTVMLLLATAVAFSEGLYLSAGAGASQFNDGPAGLLTVNAGTNLFSWLEGGLSLSAFHTLERTYTDDAGRTYQAESGFSAIYLRPHFRLAGSLEIGFPLRSGTGILQYRYSRQYRDELLRTDEILDSVTFGMYSAGVDLTLSLCPVHALILSGGYRGSSPLRTPLAEDGAWNGPYAELAYSWKLF